MKSIFLFTFLLLTLAITGQAQDTGKENKVPYKIITEGNNITIKSSIAITRVLVWTASGHRVAEAHDLNSFVWSYRVTIAENIFFIMVENADGKRTTKRIGLRR